jgi:hypothetical protein
MEKYFPDIKEIIDSLIKNKGLPPVTKEALIAYFGVILYTIIATIIIPGKIVKGVELKDGKRVPYKINALAVHLLSIVLFFLFSNFGLNYYGADIFFRIYPSLFSVGLYFSFAFSAFLFMRQFYFKKEDLNIHATNPLVNFWLGNFVFYFERC